MIPAESIIGIVILAAAIIALFKFAESTLSAVISVAVIIVGLFLIFGAPNVDSMGGKLGDMRGMIPTTGGAVFAGEAIDITGMENKGEVLVIDIHNRGATEMSEFDVFVEGEPVEVVLASTLLPGTRGTLVVAATAQGGDAVLVKSGTSRDEELFGTDEGVGVTGSTVSPLMS